MPKRNAPVDASQPDAKRQATLFSSGFLTSAEPEEVATKRRQAAKKPSENGQTKLNFGTAVVPPAVQKPRAIAATSPLAISSSSSSAPSSAPPVLSKVLADLANIDRYSTVDVKDGYALWQQSMTPAAKFAVQAIENGENITKELLLSIGGAPRNSRKAGWYLAVIVDDIDVTFFKAYVGQSENVGQRVQQHIETVRLDPTTSSAANKLLYHVWRKPGRRAIWVHLGEHRHSKIGLKEEELMLNICEQLFSEKLQTLQSSTLRRILPHESLQDPPFGLNVALPVHQPTRSLSKRQNEDAMRESRKEFSALSKSVDAEIQEYYQLNHHRFSADEQEKGRQTMAETQHVQQIYGARQGKQDKKSHLMRDAQSPGEETVEIYCMKCRSEGSRRIDPAPTYEIATGEYIARRAACPFCPRLPSAPTKNAREVMIPYNGSKFVRWDWVGTNKNREDPRWAHKRGG